MSLIHKKICRLVCDLCKRYLSRTPLCVIQTGKTICGRCIPPEGSIRELLLEKLLENKQFPCIFDKNGCLMTNKSDQTVEHERWCKYRVMMCPLSGSTQCNTRVIATDILDHIWDVHKGYVYGNHVRFMFNSTAKNEHRFILMCDSELFEISLSLCKDTGKIRHEIINTNFPFEPKRFGYTFEQGVPSVNQTIKLDDKEDLPIETGKQVMVAIVTMYSKTHDQNRPCLIECINCSQLTKPFYWHDEKQGWLCYACSSTKNICAYSIVGCVHRDRDGNLEKHTLYFCSYAIRCPICNECLTNQYIVNHYTREHLNITYLDRTQFTFNPKSSDGWFLLDSKIGKVVCHYQLTDNSLALKLHTRLRSDELNHYKCQIIVGNPNLDDGQVPISQPLETSYNSVFDWAFDLTGDSFKAIFKNGLCTIKTEFMKRVGVSSGEWFDELFQTVNESDQVILVE